VTREVAVQLRGSRRGSYYRDEGRDNTTRSHGKGPYFIKARRFEEEIW
jgi:hypothetical protein